MPSYKIGLDFGTHQTKVCLEDSSDRRNKRYFFHRFTDGEGCEHYTIPSTVMVKKDRTLAYGFVDEGEALQSRIAPLTEEPVKPTLALWSYPPKPTLPELSDPGNPPKKPCYEDIEKRIHKPVMPQPPQIEYQQPADNEVHTINDFSELGALIEKPSTVPAKPKSFGDALIEYQKAKQRYEKNIKIYKSKLKKAILKADSIYKEKMRRYKSKYDAYLEAKAKRDAMLKSYERRCQEVDEHNRRVKMSMDERMAEYEKSLQLWNKEQMRPQPIVMRYFKQSLFSSGLRWRYEWTPLQVSIWYLTYVFFDLDEKYGTENLTVNMGTSSGTKTWHKNKEVATQVILTVYHLIEDVFHHDKEAFLRCTVEEMVSLTDVVPYSDEAKRNNAIYVFPEAFANLNPMAMSGRFGNGMNMVIDIGGGTTDISLFSAPYNSDLKNCDLKIYDYISVPYGLNAVRELGIDSHKSAVSRSMYEIIRRIENHARNIGVPEQETNRVLQKRPIVYTGGGSTLNELCCGYAGFTDIRHLRDNVASTILIENRERVIKMMAVLSTALGLAICKDDDSEIKLQTIRELFKNVEEAYSERQQNNDNDKYEHGLSDL